MTDHQEVITPDDWDELVTVTADQVIARIAERAATTECCPPAPVIPIRERLAAADRVRSRHYEDRHSAALPSRLWFAGMVAIFALALYGVYGLVGGFETAATLQPLTDQAAAALPAFNSVGGTRQGYYRLHCTVNDYREGLQHRWLRDEKYGLPDGTVIEVSLYGYMAPERVRVGG